MGDGVVRKYAIIINGDTEQRPLANVTRAATTLKKGGYTVHVASPTVPGVSVDRYNFFAPLPIPSIELTFLRKV